MANIDTGEMYASYAGAVYRYLLRLSGSTQDAEELCAETFYQAVRSIERYDGSCKLQTWLFQIAKHLWYKELERRKRKTADWEAEAPALVAPDNVENEVLAGEAKLDLYQRMQRLDAATREVMYLRLSGELSFKEIGEVLGKTETWARVTFYRGKERMKKDG